MRHLLLIALLAACGPGPDGGVPATQILVDAETTNPNWPDYEESLGSYAAFVHGCDLEGGEASISCVLDRFGLVQMDIDNCARSKGLDDELIEEYRWKSHIYEVDDSMSPAETEHLLRSQEFREVRIDARSVLPCRRDNTIAEDVWPYLGDAWEMGGCDT